MKKKMNCKDCIRTCCDMMEIRRRNKKEGLDPDKIKVGDWLEVIGITFKKLKNGLWRCIAFDYKTRLCKIWKYRPNVCRIWSCSLCKKTYRKTALNWSELSDLSKKENYGLHYSASSESLMKIDEKAAIEVAHISLV